MEGFAAYAKVAKRCAVRIFVDVVQAYPSLVVALDLPLPQHDDETKLLLREAGFSVDEVLEIMAESVDLTEWGDASEHLRHVIAVFQEDQWNSSDYSGGVMASCVGAAAGLPLAGIVAVIVLSRITRKIQAGLKEKGLMVQLPTDDARDELGPGGLMDWQPNFEYSNFGIADDDVFVHLAPTSARRP